jgi:ABC-type nitrate/sulfonate/bicarbonate transport system substrate-binding protein
LTVPSFQHRRSQVLKIGYTALTDSAPLIMAESLGLFTKYGLSVVLSREVGWATIRDKLIYGELDAAHAPAGLLAAVQCGLGCLQADCLTGLILSLNGNAITLSQRLWQEGVHTASTLHDYIRATGFRPTLGIVYPHSSHRFLLREWLLAAKIDPLSDVRLVVVPPAQMHSNLKAGNLDGYCVGEPWNSLAVLSKQGWITATSAQLDPGHPEKVLMVRRDFADRCENEHLALIAALIEACRFCAAPRNRERLIETLADQNRIDAPVHAIAASFSGLFDFGNGRTEKTGGQHIFHAPGANEPSAAKAAWLLRKFKAPGAIDDPDSISASALCAAFRIDLYHKAASLAPSYEPAQH